MPGQSGGCHSLSLRQPPRRPDSPRAAVHRLFSHRPTHHIPSFSTLPDREASLSAKSPTHPSGARHGPSGQALHLESGATRRARGLFTHHVSTLPTYVLKRKFPGQFDFNTCLPERRTAQKVADVLATATFIESGRFASLFVGAAILYFIPTYVNVLRILIGFGRFGIRTRFPTLVGQRHS